MYGRWYPRQKELPEYGTPGSTCKFFIGCGTGHGVNIRYTTTVYNIDQYGRFECGSQGKFF